MTDALADRFREVLWGDAIVRDALYRARMIGLPQWRIVAGALYNAVWNHLTGRPPGYGLKDIDLIYFDASDLGYDAEDAVVQRVARVFGAFPVPVETRNQARVHLWYEDRFGAAYEPLRCADEALERYASTTHAVGVRLQSDGYLNIHAPFGLEDVFAMHLRPNRVLDNRRTYEAKAERARSIWPEITVETWAA